MDALSALSAATGQFVLANGVMERVELARMLTLADAEIDKPVAAILRAGKIKLLRVCYAQRHSLLGIAVTRPAALLRRAPPPRAHRPHRCNC